MLYAETLSAPHRDFAGVVARQAVGSGVSNNAFPDHHDLWFELQRDFIFTA